MSRHIRDNDYIVTLNSIRDGERKIFANGSAEVYENSNPYSNKDSELYLYIYTDGNGTYNVREAKAFIKELQQAVTYAENVSKKMKKK